MNIRPLNDYVIVYRREAQHLSAGGIVIPDSASEKPDQGDVLAVGRGRMLLNGKLTPMGVKQGDHVLFARHKGTEIKQKEEKMLVLHESDILAVLED